MTPHKGWLKETKMGLEEDKKMETKEDSKTDETVVDDTSKEDASIEVFADIAGEDVIVEEPKTDEEKVEEPPQEDAKEKVVKEIKAEDKKEEDPKKEDERDKKKEDVKTTEFKTLREALQFEIKSIRASKEELKEGEEDKKAIAEKKKDSSGPNWESESNPYKARQTDTRDWANRVASQNQVLQGEIGRLSKNLNIVTKQLQDQGTSFEGLQETSQQQIQSPSSSASPELIASVDAAHALFEKDEPGIVGKSTQFIVTPGALTPEGLARLQTSNSPAITAVQLYKESLTEHKVEEKKEAMENGNGKSSSNVDVDVIIDAVLKRLGKSGDEDPSQFPTGISGMQGETEKGTKDKTGSTDNKSVDPFGEFAG